MSNLHLPELTLLFYPTLSWTELEQWCPSNKQKRRMPLWEAVAKMLQKMLWPLQPLHSAALWVTHQPRATSFTSLVTCSCVLRTPRKPAERSFHGENDTKERHLKLCFSSLASSHVSRRGFLTPTTTRAWITSIPYWFLAQTSKTADIWFSPFLSFVYEYAMHVGIHEWSYLYVSAYTCMRTHTWRLKVAIRLLSASPSVLRQRQIKPRADHFS